MRHQKKSKKHKDPNMPKRPLSAYFLWLSESRERIKKENPGISMTEVSKKGGEEWKLVDDKTVCLKFSSVASFKVIVVN